MENKKGKEFFIFILTARVHLSDVLVFTSVLGSRLMRQAVSRLTLFFIV